ncbi:MAG TPA: acyl-CoA dehydrogenase family protein [Syntrophorhabdaceae bacterium]|nr:acyl-CoA dehydrogenase family protein [Syntrophorhabdaceae bacterium]HQM82359.1 acyl-CoA dehydrogenase family protein [Syntrophorhabdaceae bacterium]
MESYFWWTDEQRKFAEEVRAFVKEVMPRDAETRWTREFPWDIFRKIGEKGFTGAGIPKEYGGLGLGATGACIAAEAFNRMPGPGRAFVGNMLGGLRQIIEYGSEEQKRNILPRIAKGELGAIVITEPFAGTDAAAIETTARREGDVYILSGKKRYIVSAGVATRHMVYARTSNNPEDIKSYRHLTAFIVEKGTPGFSVEKINEIIGFENIQNGVLNFDKVPVPVGNRIGEEGEGWRVMTAGLNFERTLIAASVVGWIGELLKNAVPYAQRRVQFGRPTIDIPTNQFKIADLIIKTKIARLMTYYTAYLWDLGVDITVESNVAKVFNCESAMQASIDAIQVMGGDGVTPFYPLEEIMNVAKVENIAGGTMEACRLVIFRTALRQMAQDLRMQRRVIHPELGVPVPASGISDKMKDINEDNLLAAIAEDYRVNPGLFMSREDIKEIFDVDNAVLDDLLTSLEKKGLVKLYRAKKGVELAKATYEGLNRAHPLEYYKWFPAWIGNGKDRVF